MGPAHQRSLVLSTGAGLALQTIADKFFYPCMVNTRVTALYVSVTTATTAADPATVQLERRVTMGSDTGRVNTGVPSVIVPGGSAVGATFYKKVNFEFLAGQEMVLRLTDAVAAGAGHVTLWIEEDWEEPANATGMV